MVNKKHTLKLGIVLAVLMFLLINLLSSPVSAAFTQPHGSVTTDNKTTGPEADGDTPLGGDIFDSSPFNARFSLTYTYTDYTSGSGSDNWMVVLVWYQRGGIGDYIEADPSIQTKIRLTPDGSPSVSDSGTYNSDWINSYGGTGTQFEVIVEAYCYDIDTLQTAKWVGPGQSYIVS